MHDRIVHVPIGGLGFGYREEVFEGRDNEVLEMVHDALDGRFSSLIERACGERSRNEDGDEQGTGALTHTLLPWRPIRPLKTRRFAGGALPAYGRSDGTRAFPTPAR